MDVGCGCGVIGLLLARDFGVALTGVDIQEEMIAFSRENSVLNGIAAQFVATDFRAFGSETKFNTIVSNPPFYHAKTTPSRNESLRFARYANALPLGDLLACAGRLLDSKGDLFFCYDAAAAFLVMQTLANYRYHLKSLLFVHTAKDQAARLMLVHAKKSLVKAAKILPPIFLRNEDGSQSEIRAISHRAETVCLA